MKIAICVSGAIRTGVNEGTNRQDLNTDYRRDFNSLKRNFPTADFYHGTWKEYAKVANKWFPDIQVQLFDSPIPHYHPYLDMPPGDVISKKMAAFQNIYRKRGKLHQRTRYQAHQILCHAKMVDSLPEKYDIIIRTRFDTFTYMHANFDPYIQDVYNNKTAIGFASPGKMSPRFNIPCELDKNDPKNSDGAVGRDNNLEKYLLDQLIIHHGDRIDTKFIFELYNQKKLCPAEFGWYQVLSKPYNDNHRCVWEWAQTNRYVRSEFLNGAKKSSFNQWTNSS